jgi:P27 family predicted phage terminase small subunit
MTTHEKPPPPHLSEAAKKWWRAVLKHFEPSETDFHLLKLAAESLDLAEQARQAIERSGAVVKDRFNQNVPAPWVKIQRDAQHTFAALIKQLGLNDLNVPHNQPRRAHGRK